MIEREKNILNAANNVFMRYGIKRTTMNDIAEEADVSRQTLYNSFANKEAIFKAIIQLYTEETLNAFRDHSENSGDIAAGLNIAFECMAFRPFDIMHGSPHGIDLIEGIGNAAADELELANEQFRAAIEDMLKPHEASIKKADLTPRGLSDLVTHSIFAFKHKADNRKHLQELLNNLKTMVLLVTGETHTPS